MIKKKKIKRSSKDNFYVGDDPVLIASLAPPRDEIEEKIDAIVSLEASNELRNLCKLVLELQDEISALKIKIIDLESENGILKSQVESIDNWRYGRSNW